MRFSWKTYSIAGFLLAMGFWGCHSKSLPVAPNRPAVLTVSVPIPSNVRSSLLGATSNEILYNLSVPGGGSPITGKAGPFASSSVTGTIDFTITLSTNAGSRVLALQLNDVSNNSPLALGAVALTLGSSDTGVTVEMGSVIRSCYSVSSFPAVGGGYAFDTNTVNGAVTDVSVVTSVTGYQFQSGATIPNNIAYMGNGDMVNFAYVPPDSQFWNTSGGAKQAAGLSALDLAAGDIYCVKLTTGGHAWVQVVSGGSLGTTGPSFHFRANHTLPYYGYDPTTCDFLGRTPTPTFTPTITYTPTNTDTPTITNTPTLTDTNTPTSTPSNTATITPTLTPTNSPTLTATGTPTGTFTSSPTATLTYTLTNSPTLTDTGTPTGTFTASPTSTLTGTPTSTPTLTSTNTFGNSPTSTASSTSSSTATNSATPTATGTATSTATLTPTTTSSSTATVTTTFTPTDTPIVGVLDITANINGAPVTGDTTGAQDSYSQDVTFWNIIGSSFNSYGGGDPLYGAGAPDVAYKFVLSSPTNLFINLCGANFDSVIYLRTNLTDPNSLVAFNDDSDFCGTSSSSMATGTFPAGTYYLIVDGFSAGIHGQYTLSLSTFTPTCQLTPLSAPVTNTQQSNSADDSNFTNPVTLGNVNLTSDLLGVGSVNYFTNHVQTWAFMPQTSGVYAISLDCFDDGTGKARVGYDLYSSGITLVGVSNDGDPLDQMTGNLVAGTTYYIAVYAWDDGAPNADYHLVIQGLGTTPTPTITPTITYTPTATVTSSATPTATAQGAIGLDISSGGATVTGDTTGHADSYNQPATLWNTSPGPATYLYGAGAPDIAYAVTVTSAESLFVNLCGASFDSVVYIRSGSPYGPTVSVNDDSDFCGTSSSSLVTGTLTPGTYYIIVDGFTSGDYGTFTLGISAFQPVCPQYVLPSPTPVINNQTNNNADDTTFTNPVNLGTLAASGDLVGDGNVNYYFNHVQTWSFTVPAAGNYNISLDCFDDNTGKARVGFDIYQGGGIVPTLFDVSADNDPLDQLTESLSAGVTYYVAVYAFDEGAPSGNYRLTVTGQGGIPTPTPSTIPDISYAIGQGITITGNTTGGTDNYSQTVNTGFYDSNGTYGVGAPDMVYQFVPPQTGEYALILDNGSFSGAVFYIRTNLTNPASTTDLSDGSDGNTSLSLVTGTLTQGVTYYLIVDGVTTGDYGTYGFTIAPFNPICSLNPVSTPVTYNGPLITGDDYGWNGGTINASDMTNAVNLGTITTDAVGVGNYNWAFNGTNVWQFTAPTSGNYAISTDCFSDGSYIEYADMYLWSNSDGVSLLNSSYGTPLNQMTVSLTAGQTYYVEVQPDWDGQDGNYRLVVQNLANVTVVPTSTPTITPTLPPTPVTYRILPANPSNYTDTQGNAWSGGAGGDVTIPGYTGPGGFYNSSTSLPILGTSDPRLYTDYFSNGSGAQTFTFNEPLGSYQVTLKFGSVQGPFNVGANVFNVSINGTQVQHDLDLYAEVGGNAADDKVFNNITPVFNPSAVAYQIQVAVGPAVNGSPYVGAIQIIPQSSAVATATPTPTRAPSSTWRVIAGGASPYLKLPYRDSQGKLWTGDMDFTGGVFTASSSPSSISGTNDPTLYQNYREGNMTNVSNYQPFSYSFPVPPGNYQVTLKFNENTYSYVGGRVFNVSINGNQVLSNLDVFSDVGMNAADDKVINNIAPDVTGHINIGFGPTSSTSNSNQVMVSAIQIIPQAGAATPTGTPTATPTSTITSTPTITPTPSGAVFMDISGGSASTSGNTVGMPDSYNQPANAWMGDGYSNYDYGLGAPDEAFYFTVSPAQAGQKFFISVCGANFDSVLYVRSGSPVGSLVALDDDSDYCASTSATPASSSLVTGPLAAGNYYVIVDGFGPGDAGSFTLNIGAFNPTCSLTPVSAPVTSTQTGAVSVDDTTFTNPVTFTPSLTFGNDLVGVGNVNNYLNHVNTWKFTQSATASCVISLDCFDDGTGKARAGFDLYDASYNLVASSPNGDPLDQISGSLPAGTYYVAVYAWDYGAPNANYRLVIQDPGFSPTPTVTSSPTITATPLPGPVNYSAPVTVSDLTGAPTPNGPSGPLGIGLYNNHIYSVADNAQLSLGTILAFEYPLTVSSNPITYASSTYGTSVSAEQMAYSNSTNKFYFAVTGSEPLAVMDPTTNPMSFSTIPLYTGTASYFGVAVDNSGGSYNGDIYVTDTVNNRVARYNGSSWVSFGGPGSGTGQFNDAEGLWVDNNGDLWVADTGNNRVVELNPSNFSTMNTLANYAIQTPRGVAVNSKGYVFVTNLTSKNVSEISPDGAVVSPSVGNYATTSTAGLAYMTFDSSDNLYVTDTVGRVLEFSATAPTPTPVYTPPPMAPENYTSPIALPLNTMNEPNALAVNNGILYVGDWATNRILAYPLGSSVPTTVTTYPGAAGQIAFDSYNNMFVSAISNNQIDEFNPNTGTLLESFGTLGSAPGQFNGPIGVAIDNSSGPNAGDIYIAEQNNNRITRYNGSTFVTVGGTLSGSGLGQFYQPEGMTVDSSGNIWVADTANSRVVELSPNLTVHQTISISSPYGVAISPRGYVFVTSYFNNEVSEFNPNGTLVTAKIANATITNPRSLAFDANDNLYVSSNLTTVFEFQINPPTPTPTPLPLGSQPEYYTTASLYNPPSYSTAEGIAANSAGTSLYVNYYYGGAGYPAYNPVSLFAYQLPLSGASTPTTFNDTSDYEAYQIALNSAGTTLYSLDYNGYIWEFNTTTGTGPNIPAPVNLPRGLAVDNSGDIYIGDTGNNRVLKYNGSSFTTIGGTTPGLAIGSFYSPSGLGLDASGNVWVADFSNNRIVKLSPSLQVLATLSGPGINQPYDVAVSPHGYIFVVNYGASNCLSEFDPNGTLLYSNIAGSIISYARYLAFDSSDNLYVSSANGIYVLGTMPNPTPTGTPTSTPTATGTPTVTGTPTITPTPSTATDISANINGSPVIGDTTGMEDYYSQPVTYWNISNDPTAILGAGAPDITYQFTVDAAHAGESLFINLCGANFDSVLYLRSGSPTGPTVAVDDDSDFCGSTSSSLVTGSLPQGTYYLTVDGFTSGDYGPFTLNLSTFAPLCTITPTSTPVPNAEPSGDDSAFSQATYLGTVSSGTDAVGSGSLNYFTHHVDTWHFHAGTNGALYTVSLDCFDDGTSKARFGFDIYQLQKNYSYSAASFQLVASSNDNDPLDQVVQTLPAGDYYIAVYASDEGAPGGNYHLIIQGGSVATATPTATATITPSPTPGISIQDITAIIGAGVTVSGDTTNAANNFYQPVTYSGTVSNLGLGPDAIYRFVAPATGEYFINLCGTSFNSVIYVRTNPTDPTSVTDLDQYSAYCGGTGSSLTTGVLSQGVTYYLIVDGQTASDYGTYNLSIAPFTPQCTLTPTSTPVAYTAPANTTNYPDYTNAIDLGTVSAGGDAVGMGTANNNFNYTNTWKFTVGTSGGDYAFTLDCFDDGTGKNLDDVWLYDSNPLDENSPLGSATAGTPINQLTMANLAAGTYYIVVSPDDDGADGAYRLVIQGFPSSTATPTVTITATPTDTPLLSFTPTDTPTDTSTNTPTSSFTPSVTPSNTMTPTATAPVSVWRESELTYEVTDSGGNIWNSSANLNNFNPAGTTGNSEQYNFSGTHDGYLYEDYREATGAPITYTFPVPAGQYQVTLKLAEAVSQYWSVGARVFDVSINGTQVLTNLDIYSEVGGFAADDKVFNNISPVGGNITIQYGPASAGYALIQGVAIVPQPMATPTVTPTAVAVAQSNWRVAAGTNTPYRDHEGKLWSPDENYNGGGYMPQGPPYVLGTADPTLYHGTRQGIMPFTYTFPMLPGNYQVTLKFAEDYYYYAGSRVFNVSINGNQVLTNLDLDAKAGEYHADDEVFNNITPVGGNITLQFGPASAGMPQINAIEIVQQPLLTTPSITSTSTITLTPTITPTPTNTLNPSITPTLTSTPTVTSTATIQAGIPTVTVDGLSVNGNTTGGTDNYSQPATLWDSVNGITYNYGAGAPDAVYSFHLSSRKSVFISLCGAPFDSVIYVRTNPNDPTSTVALDDDSEYCGGISSSLVTGSLPAGTYYVIVDGFTAGDYGPFTLSVSTFNPICQLTPNTTPVVGWQTQNVADDSYFSNPVQMGNVMNGQDAVGTGTVNYYFNHANTWAFNASTDGAYTISLDCFDDGTNKARMGFDLYQYTSSNGYQLVASSADNDPLDQVTENLVAGTYTVAVYAIDAEAPGGDYRLVVHTGTVPTATPTPTSTPTPAFTPRSADITALIDTGNPVTGDTTGLPSGYSQPATYTGEGTSVEDYGQGSPAVVYQFTLSSPKNLYLNSCASSFSDFIFIRTRLNDPTSTVAMGTWNNNYCNEKASFTTGTLPAGTYYLILTGDNSYDYGTYGFTLSTFHPICAVSPAPLSTPVANVTPSGDAAFFSKPTYLGTVSNGNDKVGMGTLNYYFNPTETWHFKAGTNGGTYTVSLDCYDDGTGKAQLQFNLYNAQHQAFPVSYSNSYPNQIVQTLPAGDYYVAVSSTSEEYPGGDYHLVVQGGAVATPTATPTPSPTITATPMPVPGGLKALWTVKDANLTYPLANPGGLAVNSAGTSVYMSFNYKSSYYYDPHIQVWTSSNGINYSAASTWTISGSDPQALATDAAGNLYIADASQNAVEKYSYNGSLIRYIGQYYFYGATGVGVDSNGDVYSNYYSYYIYDFNYLGNYTGYFYDGLTDPAIATNSTGTTIYVAGLNAGTIQVYSPTGTSYGTWGSGAGSFGVGALAVAPPGGPYAGNLYATDAVNGRVLSFDSTGRFTGAWGSTGNQPGQFSVPGGVAVDGQGYVYVSDWGDGRVQKFAPPAPQVTYPTATPTVPTTPTLSPTPIPAGCTNLGYGTATTDNFSATNTVYYNMYNLPVSAVFGGFQVEVLQPAKVEMALYQDLNGFPSYPVTDVSGAITLDTGVFQATAGMNSYSNFAGPVTLSPGNYWIGFATDKADNSPNDNLHARLLGVQGSVIVAGQPLGAKILTQPGVPSVSNTPTNGNEFDTSVLVCSIPSSTPTPSDTPTDTPTDTPLFTFTPTSTPTITPTIESPTGYFGGQGTGSGLFSNPDGLAVNSAGTTVYVSDYSQDNVQAFTGSAGSYAYSFQWGSYGTSGNFKFASAAGLATDNSGNVYVVDGNNGRVMEYNSTGTSFVRQLGSFNCGPGEFTAPFDVALDGSGNIYVTNDNTNGLCYSMESFNSSGTNTSNWNPYSNPFGVAVNAAGTTVYLSASNGQVGAFSPNGAVTYAQWNGSSSGTAFSNPYGLAVDSNGDLYVSDYGNNRIVKFDYAGNYLNQLGSAGSLPGQFQGPYAVALDGSNNVYVLDHGNYRVQKFPPIP